MTFLYRIYQILILLPVAFIDTLIVCLIFIFGCPIDHGRYSYPIPSRLWGWIIVRFTLLPVTVIGREKLSPDQSYVFVANHQGCYDIFLLFGFLGRNFRWMMKSELGRIPVFGPACVHSGQVLVDNSSVAKVRRCYREARDILRNGVSLAVFPEGARSYDGKMRPFKKGAFMLADELQLPVVPLTINGSFTVKPRTNDYGFCRWSPLTLTIHEPIYPQGQGSDNVQHLMEKSRAAIESALQ